MKKVEIQKIILRHLVAEATFGNFPLEGADLSVHIVFKRFEFELEMGKIDQDERER